MASAIARPNTTNSKVLATIQALTLIVGALAPWLGNALYLSGIDPVPSLDLTPFGFTLSVLVLAPGIVRLLRAITLQQGPGEVLVACKVEIEPTLTGVQVVGSINDFERRVKEKRPEVKWLFVEPDDHA